MITMKCNVGDERTVVLTYCGRKVLKHGDIIYVDEKDLVQPEISYLVKSGLLIVVSDSEEDQLVVTAAIRPDADIFSCTLSKGRRMAIDSIKGTVSGGGTIEINKKDQRNGDVDHCIRSGILVMVGGNENENNVEEFIIPIDKTEATAKNDESEALHDVKITEVKTFYRTVNSDMNMVQYH